MHRATYSAGKAHTIKWDIKLQKYNSVGAHMRAVDDADNAFRLLSLQQSRFGAAGRRVHCQFKRSADACKAACVAAPDCITWQYRSAHTYLSGNTLMTDGVIDDRNELLPQECDKCGVAWRGMCCFRADDMWDAVVGGLNAGGSSSGVAARFAGMLPPDVVSMPKGASALGGRYDNIWQLARSFCHARGQDLCPAQSLCADDIPLVPTSALHASHSPWTPVLDGCNYWLDQATCLMYKNEYDRKEWPQQEESNAYWRAVSPMSALQGYNLACCGNGGSRYYSSCVPKRPCRKVLAITVNHGGAGLFAWLLFALNQLMYAEKHNVRGSLFLHFTRNACFVS